MTIRSAREKRASIDDPAGYCLSLSVDSLLTVSELPSYYYDMFYSTNRDRNGSYNACISDLLKNFFQVEPQGPTEVASIAKFNAFGSSPQEYMTDVGPTEELADYASMTSVGIEPSQIRLRGLLNKATTLGCLTLYTSMGKIGEHVRAIDCIDPGRKPDLAQFVVRNNLNIVGGIVTPLDLSGINRTLGRRDVEDPTLPELSRSEFPDGKQSWELIILPPDPGL